VARDHERGGSDHSQRPLEAAYRQLAVAFVPDLAADSITSERLAMWRNMYAPLHDALDLLAEVLRRLGIDYWWAQKEAGRLATDCMSVAPQAATRFRKRK